MNPGDRVKIAVHLVRDADDYPPADWEHLWAICRSETEYQIDNIPFFAKEVSDGDIVAVKHANAELVFDRVIRASGHSTLRVILFGDTSKEKVRADLAALGCETEGSHLPSLISVDVPPQVEYEAVLGYLRSAAERDQLDYEEAAIRH
jgi:hypothetical protein